MDTVGILIVNLGTPESPDVRAVRRYLNEFLMDPRVIEMPKILRWILLKCVILPFRPRRSAEAYASIWDYERSDSPLRISTQGISEKINQYLQGSSPSVIVDYAMRYGQPSIRERLEDLMERKCHQILVVPLYPQYSGSTTASVIDGVNLSLQGSQSQPTLRWLPPYYQDPDYIAAICTSLTTHLNNLDWSPEVILASFHGLPQRYIERGDPYLEQCNETVQRLRERLHFSEDYLQITFQSRLGPTKWLKPYTDDVLKDLAINGVKRVVVTTPGFATDCLETLEEISLRGLRTFLDKGGEAMSVVPCLNESQVACELYSTLLRKELAGWVDFTHS